MNITKSAEGYIQQHPSIKDCLKRDMINYSQLSRSIVEELGLKDKDFDAVLIACRRYSRKIKTEKLLEKEIIALLSRSKIEVKNKIVTAELEKDIFYGGLVELEKEIKKSKGILNIIDGSSAITIITSEEFLGLINKQFKNKIMKISKGLVEISMISGETLEKVPGVIAYLTTLLAEKDINIVEVLSCWTDTIFVLDEKDLVRALEALRF